MKTLGHYHLERELGRGAAGVVYAARDANGERVAVKVLLQGRSDVQQRRRLLREAEALRRLDHPHVVRVRDAGEQDDVPYLVLDFVEGASLAALLERQGPWEPAAAVELVRVLADALAHAHARGVIHRDVKPENVLVDAAGQPHLTDFGLTRDLDPALDQTRLSKTGVFLGTPAYWPPEQARGQLDAIGPWSDVYALGGTLYALLTGTPPHDAGSLPLALDQAERLPPPPSQRRAQVPSALDAICLRCLHPDPRRRYQRAEDLAQALTEFLTPRSRAGVSRSAIGLASALLVLGATVAAGLVWARSPGAARDPGAPADPNATPSQPASLDAQLEAAWWDLRSMAPWDQIEARYQAILERWPDQPGALAGLGALRFEQLRVLEGTQLQGAALRAAPTDGWVRLAAALVNAKLNSPESGIVFVRLALDARPDLAAGWTELAALEEAHGDPQASRVAAQRALDLRPELALAWLRRGLATQDPQQALADIRHALQLDPDHPLAHAALASLLARDGDHVEEALQHWERAFDRPPSTVHVYRQQRAELFGALGRLDDAVADLSALVSHLERPRYWLDLARVRSLGGWVDETRAALDRVLELDPRSTAARVGLADWWRQRGRLDRATQALGPLFAEPSPPPEAYLARALVRLELGDWPGALADLRVCDDADPTPNPELVAEALKHLAVAEREHLPHLRGAASLVSALEHADRWIVMDHFHTAAQQGYERALEFEPTHPQALAGLALLAARSGDAPRASELLAQARAGDRRAADLHEAQILAWHGDLAGGLRQLNAMIEADPDDTRARNARARSHLTHGNPADALPDVLAAGEQGNLEQRMVWADTCLLLNRFDEALRAIDIAFDLAPLDARIHLRRAEALLTLGRGPDALTALDAHLRTAPVDSAQGYLLRARVLCMTDPSESGLSAAERSARDALARGGVRAHAFHTLGVVAHARGDFEGSLGPLRRAVELAPMNPSYRSQVASALRAAQRPREALLHAEAAIRLERHAGEDSVADEVLRAWCLFSGGRLSEARQELRRLREAAAGDTKLQASLEALRIELGRAQ